MSDPRFEIVRTDAEQPWHARIIGANGLKRWHTENFTRRRAAVAAIEFVCGDTIRHSPFAAHPEITWANNTERPTEVRDVDEREAP